jgi:hypothetical protein
MKQIIEEKLTFQTTTIQRILKNVAYIGEIKYDGKIYLGLHEPIISIKRNSGHLEYAIPTAKT